MLMISRATGWIRRDCDAKFTLYSFVFWTYLWQPGFSFVDVHSNNLKVSWDSSCWTPPGLVHWMVGESRAGQLSPLKILKILKHESHWITMLLRWEWSWRSFWIFGTFSMQSLRLGQQWHRVLETLHRIDLKQPNSHGNGASMSIYEHLPV